jgi:S-adenosylmethionine decarboxylase
MCGDTEPHEAVGVLRQAFQPRTLNIFEHKRGVMP